MTRTYICACVLHPLGKSEQQKSGLRVEKNELIHEWVFSVLCWFKSNHHCDIWAILSDQNFECCIPQIILLT